MSTAMSKAEPAITFTAPGPGSWMLDSTHHGSRPVTRFMWHLAKDAFEDGMSQMMARYGLPLAGAIMADVHGLAYVRILAVGEKPRSSGSAPPAFVLRLLSRLHPELRRRNRIAAKALEEKAWRRDVAWWFERREVVMAGNLALQRVDLTALDDDRLLGHVEDLSDNMANLAVDGFANHGGDIIPVGLFLNACHGWGIDPADASALLRGASPATLENERLLAPVAAAIAAAPQRPESVEQVRDLGPDVAVLVDEWLDHQGWRLLSSDDIDAPALAELPELQLRALLAARPEPRRPEPPDAGPVRSLVPADQRTEFDRSLAEARHGLTQRDDAVGVAWNWPAGLIRRAMLEVGRRLVERNLAFEIEHGVELEPTELRSALAGTGPDKTELAERRAFRDRIERLDPPSNLGPEEEPPPLDAFPAPLATMAGAVLAVIDAMEHTTESDGLDGTGIGTTIYRGRACVVRSPIDAFAELQEGDVLVVPYTSPSYNSIFPLVGAMVTDHGGPMSHTAIMAREFGVPAVVGTNRATAEIGHGDLVEVDPSRGTVRTIE